MRGPARLYPTDVASDHALSFQRFVSEKRFPKQNLVFFKRFMAVECRGRIWGAKRELLDPAPVRSSRSNPTEKVAKKADDHQIKTKVGDDQIESGEVGGQPKRAVVDQNP
jgi:hypothetical protein